MAKVNIRGIAEKAGVSAAAVSYVLNGKPGVSAETRERILHIIAQEGYAPNMNSRRLATSRSYNILLVTEEKSPLSNLFYASILGALSEVCGRRGYSLVLAGQKEAVQAIRQSNADGLIFLKDPEDETRQILLRENAPFAVIDSQFSDPPYDCVRADYCSAIRTVTEYVIAQGHRRIGLFSRTDIPEYHATTLRGFREAMEAAGCELRKDWIFGDAVDMEAAKVCMERLLSMPERPTALVCAGDLIALAAMTRFREAGGNIPLDCSFASVDDLSVSQLYYPPLTTVQIDPCEMAEKAVMLLEKRYGGEREPEVVTVCSQKLIVRGSVCPPK